MRLFKMASFVIKFLVAETVNEKFNEQCLMFIGKRVLVRKKKLYKQVKHAFATPNLDQKDSL